MGRILLVEFRDQDMSVFDEVMGVLKNNTNFEHIKLNAISALSLPGLKIYPDRRKIYCNEQEVHLTVKEYDLLYLLAVNKGRVLTYEQLYQIVWKEYVQEIRTSTICYHVNNLRKKLKAVFPKAPFEIKCVREIGYSFEITSE